MERDIVFTNHNEHCPIATGEEVGDAYCACPYIEAALKAQVEHLTEIVPVSEAEAK